MGVLDTLAYYMGYARIAHVTTQPPNSLFTDNGDGTWTSPLGVTKTEVIMKFSLLGRLRLLLSGKVHVVLVVWYELPVVVKGDSFRWEVMPPWDKVDQTLRV